MNKAKTFLGLSVLFGAVLFFNITNVNAKSNYSLPKKMRSSYEDSNGMLQFKLTQHYGYLKYTDKNNFYKINILHPKNGVYQSNYGKNIHFKYVNKNSIKLHLYNHDIYMYKTYKKNKSKKTIKNPEDANSKDLLKPIYDKNNSSNGSLSNGTDYNRASNEPNPNYGWTDANTNLDLAQYVYDRFNGVRTLSNLQPLEIDDSLSSLASRRAKQIVNDFSLSSNNEMITEVPVTRLTTPESASIDAINMLKKPDNNGISKIYSKDISAVGVGCYYKDGAIYTSIIIAH